MLEFRDRQHLKDLVYLAAEKEWMERQEWVEWQEEMKQKPAKITVIKEETIENEIEEYDRD